MRISTTFQATTLLVFTLNAHAESIPVNAGKLLNKSFPMAEIRSVAIGDLDGDGINDLVAVIASTSAGRDKQRIVVLKGVQQGQYQVWSQSEQFPELRKGGPDLAVKRGSFFVYSADATCCVAAYQHLQFKYNGKNFRLIGVRTGENSTTQADDFDRDVSFNVVTGDKVETKRVGKHRQQVQFKLPTQESQVLEAFDMDLAPWIAEAVQFGIGDNSGPKAVSTRSK